MANHEQENPFYHNYIFSDFDLKRAKIGWWTELLLKIFIHPTYVQIGDKHVYHFKIFGGRYYFLKADKFPISSPPGT